MIKKIILSILLISLLGIVYCGRFLYCRYVPLNVDALIVSVPDTTEWKTHRFEEFGLDIKYPPTYFPCKIRTNSVSLRQDTASAAECKTLGKRIKLQVFPMDRLQNFGLGSTSIKVKKDTTVNDISRQFLKGSRGPWDQRSSLPGKLNGVDTVICTERVPGESPRIYGEIFTLHAFVIYETPEGERILLTISNNGGGTPRVGDRDLQRDLIGILQALRWTSKLNSATD